MIPYATFLYFGILLYLLIAFSLDGIIRKKRFRSIHYWILGMTLTMLIVQYANVHEAVLHHTPRELWMVLLYALIQWINTRVFLAVSLRAKNLTAFLVSIAVALLPLLLVKIFGNKFHGPDHPVFGFLGISYITFRTIDVLIGIRDGVIKKVSTATYWAYLLFFPTISSGPIDRFRRFEKDWDKSFSRQDFIKNLDRGIALIAQGFLYKFILAALIETHWLKKVVASQAVLAKIAYMYGYTFYLFFDFAGYSAFAIGVSNILGFDIIPNFKRPFFAKNIRDFWDRWHISLSWWFRDHIYMRFVMLATKKKWFSNKFTASYLGYLLTMLLMGVWHGWSLHYIVYGLYHGFLLVGYDVFARWNKKRQLFSGFFGEIASIVITFHVVCFGLLIFSGHLF